MIIRLIRPAAWVQTFKGKSTYLWLAQFDTGCNWLFLKRNTIRSKNALYFKSYNQICGGCKYFVLPRGQNSPAYNIQYLQFLQGAERWWLPYPRPGTHPRDNWSRLLLSLFLLKQCWRVLQRLFTANDSHTHIWRRKKNQNLKKKTSKKVYQ